MKFNKYIGITALVLFFLLAVAVGGLWLHNNNYSGTITEFRDIGQPQGLIFSLDGKYPTEKMMLQIQGINVRKFLHADGRNNLPHEGDLVQIKGHIQNYTGRDGNEHRMIVVTDPSQIVIQSRPVP